VVGSVLELMARRKDGTEFPIEIAVSSIRRDGDWWAVAVIRDITKRKQAEEALRREQRLLRRLLDLQDRERKLLAYEIHDGLAQQLAGATMQLQATRQQNTGSARETTDQVIELLGEATGEARRLIAGLRPPILDEEGIVAAVEYLIRQHELAAGPEVEFTHEVGPERFAPALENAIFRITQESLTNAARYSESERTRVDLRQKETTVVLEVEDWGVGFDPAEVEEARFGLQGIRERARLLGGRAHIDSQPGQGTRISVELPLVDP
jgi:signal transduction histidine kinase